MGMMLNLPQLLSASAPGTAASARRTSDRSCIFILQAGGPPHIDIFDMKPDAPTEIRGAFKPIATAAPGMQITELFPQMARLGQRFSLIRSMSHQDSSHNLTTFLSGQSKPAPDAPYFGSILSKVRPSSELVPSYVWLQEAEKDAGEGWRGGGALGLAHAPLRIGDVRENYAQPGFRVKAFDSAVAPGRLQGRSQLLQRLGSRNASSGQADPGDKFRRLQERALELVSEPTARKAFDLEQEPAQVRDRYGRNIFGQNLLAARRMIEAGVRLVTVHAFPGAHPIEVKNGNPGYINIWDMHAGFKVTIFEMLAWLLPQMDQAVSALLEDLEARRLLDSTLVVMGGEMGRTPRMSGIGRDHWPYCYSALLAGAGIRGGRVYGASDKIGAYVKDKPVSPEAFAATLLHAMGVPPETRLSADGATRPASTGQPILELFG